MTVTARFQDGYGLATRGFSWTSDASGWTAVEGPCPELQLAAVRPSCCPGSSNPVRFILLLPVMALWLAQLDVVALVDAGWLPLG